MSRPRYGFAAHPDAIDDLAELPNDILDLTVLGLQQLVHGTQRGQRLDDRLGPHLDGARKLYVDPRVAWRVVYREQPAPPGSAHPTEIFLIAVGPRRDSAVYTTAAARLAELELPAPSREPDAVSSAVPLTRPAPPKPLNAPPSARLHRSR